MSPSVRRSKWPELFLSWWRVPWGALLEAGRDLLDRLPERRVVLRSGDGLPANGGLGGLPEQATVQVRDDLSGRCDSAQRAGVEGGDVAIAAFPAVELELKPATQRQVDVAGREGNCAIRHQARRSSTRQRAAATMPCRTAFGLMAIWSVGPGGLSRKLRPA